MREIKFRAWHEQSKTMIMPPGIYDSEVGPYTMTFDGRIYSAGFYKDFQLMQYTGLKDKNGKEIYEGDLIKLGNPRKTFLPIEEDNAVGEVIFSYGSFNVFDTPLSDVTDWHECEVIGSIYENPELINKEKI